MINTLRDREDDARGSRIIWNAVETSRLLKNLRDIFDKILPEGLGGWAVDVDRTIYHREMSLPRGWLKNPWKVEARVDALMRTDCDGFIQERRRRSSRRPSRKRHDDRLFFFFPLVSFLLSTHAHAHWRRVADLLGLIEIYSRLLIGRNHHFRRGRDPCISISDGGSFQTRRTARGGEIW